MPDLFRAESIAGYWYSLIAASPNPEVGERVNVAVLFGNGQATHLRYLEHLPRLCGIAAADEINVYQAVLDSVADRVARGAELAVVAALLAPQMTVQEPRALYREISNQLVERIAARYLAPAKDPPREVNMEALIRKSVAMLDEAIERARPKGVLVARNVKPRTLYDGRIDRVVPFSVPKLARALRGFGRDVLVDSLVVESDQDAGNVRMAAGRIGQAFFAYDKKLKSIIKQYAGRDLRTVGILQPSQDNRSDDTQALREYIRDSWSQHAVVIDADEQDVQAALRSQAEWILEGAA